ncbi:MAG: hypothetical protein HOD63_08750 [Bacteroidetes bacterium]|jgi:hypothetical protein|nr:hypothetical protein [Bacteroidota bacterium]MBT5527604.1 hypothetical protein [Cytophagia bacterium]MBT3422605.1 hypothetical protein [Bacteroidota bacterium]MBT3934502.1 hypothetical protein [Bacteroidota bacterium]MBT4338666.1 hypothetical protein [Bacteroidota bacterium]
MIENSKKKLWENPWGYKESFIISIGFLIIGFVLEVISGSKGVSAPSWPVNIVIILIFMVYIVLCSLYIKHPIIKWLSSIQATVSAVSIFTVLVLLMGFIRQEDQGATGLVKSLGLSHVAQSWSYLLSALYLLLILGFTTFRRMKPFNLKNSAFFLNHFGLWLIVVSASLGSGDMYKLQLRINEGNTMQEASDGKYTYRIPFKVKLVDFHIKEYPPEIGLLDIGAGMLEIEKGDKLLLVEDQEKEFGNWKANITKYLGYSKQMGDSFVVDSSFGSFASVYIEALNLKTKEKKQGWVTYGNFMARPKYLYLDADYALAMVQPKPEKYSSDLTIYTDDNEFEDHKLEVNKPIRVNGWVLYQTGYDDRFGKWSDVSIIELVRDPWIKVVYIGIFMVLFGALYLLWVGSGRKQ